VLAVWKASPAFAEQILFMRGVQFALAICEEIKVRLDNVISAATKYGSQAEQLAATRASLTDCLSQVKETNEELRSLTRQTGEVLEDTGKLINGALTDDLQPEIDKVHSLISKCEEQLSGVTSHYQAALDNLERSKDVFAEQHHQAEVMLSQTVGEVKNALQDAQCSIAELESNNVSLQKELVETVKGTFSHIEEAIIGLTETLNALGISISAFTTDQTQNVSKLETSMQEISRENHKIQQSLENESGTLQHAVNDSKQVLLSSVTSEANHVKEELSNIHDALHNDVEVATAKQIKIASDLENSVVDVSQKIEHLSENLLQSHHTLHSLESKADTLQNCISSSEQALSATIATEGTHFRERFDSIQEKQRTIETALLRLEEEQGTIQKELSNLVRESINQANDFAKRQKAITIGCSAVITIAIIVLFLLR
ncbi:MAG: hypothetical protein Q4B32_07550, partial [Clostridia bacterium]|nr:hypothetical protein [Clostridia bacterium]